MATLKNSDFMCKIWYTDTPQWLPALIFSISSRASISESGSLTAQRVVSRLLWGVEKHDSRGSHACFHRSSAPNGWPGNAFEEESLFELVRLYNRLMTSNWQNRDTDSTTTSYLWSRQISQIRIIKESACFTPRIWLILLFNNKPPIFWGFIPPIYGEFGDIADIISTLLEEPRIIQNDSEGHLLRQHIKGCILPIGP